MRILTIGILLLLLASPASAQIDVYEAGIAELQAAMRDGHSNSVALVDQYLARIAAYEDAGPRLNSLIRINPRAREQAAVLDAERAAGRVRGPLHGVPVIIKDNYNTDFMPTTGASVALAGFVPSANATAVQKLLDAGAVILAKSNLHEFAYGITTLSSLGGQTRNPYDPRRVPGGSSGGTAAAVAASFAAVGMGSDTCGSIRIPSAFNNLVGLRPSKGVTSIYGIMPLSHTQDVIGPLARSVEDLALVLDVVSGYDAADPATAILEGENAAVFVRGLNSQTLTGLRLGRLTNYFSDIDPAMGRVLAQALDQLRDAGVVVVDVEFPELNQLVGGSGLIGQEFKPDIDQYLAMFLSGAVSNLNDIVDLGLFHEAVEAVLTRSRATVSNPQSYESAMAMRDSLREAIEVLMKEYDLDALIYPPISQLPVFTGENQPGNNCSLSANSGLPALSMPVGFSADGLPVALELLGGSLQDVKLVSIAYRWEQLSHPRRAPATTPQLIDGQAPAPAQASLNYSGAGLNLGIAVDVDVTRSRLHYVIDNRSADPAQLYAVALSVDSADHYALTDPVFASLAGPGDIQAEGELLLSPRLLGAWQEHRLYVKVFAAGLTVQGESLRLEF